MSDVDTTAGLFLFHVDSRVAIKDSGPFIWMDAKLRIAQSRRCFRRAIIQVDNIPWLDNICMPVLGFPAAEREKRIR